MELENWITSEIGQDIWKKKYQYNNETVDEFLERVSFGDKLIKEMIKNKEFMPGGRILANARLHRYEYQLEKSTLSNCYVIEPPEDNIESIFKCASDLARTFSYGGGAGIDISNLSPAGAKVNNAAKETSGAVSFCDLYSLTSETIAQRGRRGALMISLSCNHPDLEEFIELKSEEGKVTKANISVRITDEFMRAVENDEEYLLSFTRKETGETINRTVNARKVFWRLAEMNHSQAEPGVLFWDTINNYTIMSDDPDFEYAGLNPCAEEPLAAGSCCLLSSLNLAEFTEDGKVKWNRLKECVRNAVVYLNKALDIGANLHPLEYQKRSAKKWRPIGLGVMGLGDMLINLKLRYGKPEAVEMTERIMEFICSCAIEASADLAKEQGMFPACKREVILKSEFIQKNVRDKAVLEKIKEYGLANAALLTCAPTGSISTMLGISGGGEPIFANSYMRKTESLHGQEYWYKVYTPIVESFMSANNIDNESDLPDYFVTAPNIPYKERIAMQAALQRHIDASISSTVNLPEWTTVEQVFDLYLEAWKQGLKGITIYRDNCDRAGILVNDKNDEEEVAPPEETRPLSVLKRGDIVQVYDDVVGKKRKLITGCGSLHACADFDPVDGELCETFLSKGSEGGCNSWMVFGSRMISRAMRLGDTIEGIVDQAKSCPSCVSYMVRRATKHDVSPGNCCPAAVGIALQDMYNQLQDEMNGDDYDEFELVDEVIDQVFNIPEPKCKTCEDQAALKELQEFLDGAANLKNEAENNMGICPKCGQKTYIAEGGCGHCVNDDCGFSGCD